MDVRLKRDYQKTFLSLICALLLFSSCLKEEEPVTPPDFLGNVETAQIPMGKNYDKQFFFDLGTNQIVSSNEKNVWDLAFECGLEGHHIILNTSKYMFAHNTQSTDFAAITDTAAAAWKWDVASGNLDSTAIGAWGDYADGNVFSYGHVYIIDRGKDALGNRFGLRKIVFEDLSNNFYRFRFANLDGSQEDTFQLKKNNDYSFVYFSFDNGGQEKQIAPKKDLWDLQFTMYTHIFSETPANIPRPDTAIAYLVTGVLQNRNNTAVAESNLPLDDITLENAVGMTFIENQLDVIGYNWKYFNFNEGLYTITPGKYFVIRDHEGYLFKLRFTDFYSSSGEKGYPAFVFQRL